VLGALCDGCRGGGPGITVEAREGGLYAGGGGKVGLLCAWLGILIDNAGRRGFLVEGVADTLDDVATLSQLELSDIPAREASLELTCSPSSMSVMKLKVVDWRALLAVRLLLLLFCDDVLALLICAGGGG
jgi:hypothetical protein